LGALKVETHAFEPNIDNYRVLECTLDANPGMEEFLSIYNYGLSDRSTNACMVSNLADKSHVFEIVMQDTSSYNQGHAYIINNDTAVDDCESSAVRLETLDRFWEQTLNRRPVYLIKIDIEGFEPKALKGASKLLRESPPAIIVSEITPYASRQYGESAENMIRQLMTAGYSVRLANDCPGYAMAGSVIDGPQSALFKRLSEFGPTDLCDFLFIHSSVQSSQ
jgi:FkbM family methyltransferase